MMVKRHLIAPGLSNQIKSVPDKLTVSRACACVCGWAGGKSNTPVNHITQSESAPFSGGLEGGLFPTPTKIDFLGVGGCMGAWKERRGLELEVVEEEGVNIYIYKKNSPQRVTMHDAPLPKPPSPSPPLPLPFAR